jgi:peptide/nickel transport system ATP-binding protein
MTQPQRNGADEGIGAEEVRAAAGGESAAQLTRGAAGGESAAQLARGVLTPGRSATDPSHPAPGPLARPELGERGAEQCEDATGHLGPSSERPLLRLRNLRVRIGAQTAVDGVSFDVGAGETVGLVGESGCGKSLTALSILRLLPEGLHASGEVLFEGRDLMAASERELCSVRGRRIGMVFQEPMTALNPVYTVGTQVAEAIRVHTPATRAEAAARAVELLGRVGIPSPEDRARRYPHELSGGQRQRVMLAMALSCDPALLIADEPTTALDATVQAQVLELIRAEQRARGLSMLLVSHGLGVVARMCERVVVLYAGQVVEDGPAARLLETPAHPYTAALVATVRALREAAGRAEGEARRPLPTIPGLVPAPGRWPEGCRFRERCGHADDRCVQAPVMQALGEQHDVRCFHPREGR